MERFKSIPAVTSESVMGARMLRDARARKETSFDASLTAHVQMTDAYLALEHDAGRMLPRVVLYMNGRIVGITGKGLPENVERCTFANDMGDDEVPLAGTEVRMRYLMSDTQAARCMTRGVGRSDWTGLDNRLFTNIHELPIKADVTCITSERSPYPFIVFDVDDRMGLDFTRKTSGYDYVDFVGVSPSAVAEIGAERMERMDAMLKRFDYDRMQHVTEDSSRRTATKGEPTRYEKRVFVDIFGDDEAEEQCEQGQPEAPIAQPDASRTVVEDRAKRSLMAEIAVERDGRRAAQEVSEPEPEDEDAPVAERSIDHDVSILDSLDLGDAEEEEADDGTAKAKRAAELERRAVSAGIVQAVETGHAPEAADVFADEPVPEKQASDGPEF